MVGKKERIIWISLVTVILVIFMIAMVKYRTALTSVTQRTANLEQEKSAWIQNEANLRETISELTAQTEMYATQIGSFPGNNPNIEYSLKQQGFVGNVQDIVNDLIKHPELIPYDGVLGEKMGFHNKDEIFVLTDQWVVHISTMGTLVVLGCLVIRSINGAISWEMMDSCLFD